MSFEAPITNEQASRLLQIPQGTPHIDVAPDQLQLFLDHGNRLMKVVVVDGEYRKICMED